MTWKSTAAASGLMVVATWLASHAPVGRSRALPPVPPSAARTEAALEVQREAERLHGRLQQVVTYREPSRNLFRFGAPAARPAAPARVAVPVQAPPPAAAIEPVAPPLTLTGIGEDVSGSDMIRTAIISAPDDVHVVKVGDVIDGAYRVAGITSDSVELVRVDDGSTLRLTLR